MFSNVFGTNPTTENFVPYQELQNLNSRSLLQNFPPIPLDRDNYGCYESNAQFQYSFSPDFDKNLIIVNKLRAFFCFYEL